MKYVLAVSGGVDSVVLLDMVAKRHAPQDILVAHFDHGIRGEESAADARFVTGLALLYNLRFVVGYGELPSSASEAEAREKRYEFLHAVAQEESAQLVTAHHQDDLIETVVLNVERGTGWRGLTPFSDKRILRPLTNFRKSELYEYALEHRLEWVEDATNLTDAYTRNRLRRQLSQLSDINRRTLLQLVASQQLLRALIEKEDEKLAYLTSSRYFVTMIEAAAAVELLRHQTRALLTRPQLERLLLAIKTAKPSTVYEAGNNIIVDFTSRDMLVRLPS